MKRYIVIDLYGGESTIETDLPDDFFWGMDRTTRKEGTTVWRDEEMMIVLIPEAA